MRDSVNKMALVVARAANAALSITAIPAYAQLEKVGGKLTNLQSGLISFGVSIITIALLWVGYKMALQHAKWSEVSHIFYGGIIAGAAPGLAGWIFG